MFELFETRQYITQREVYQDFLEFVVQATKSEAGYLHLYDEEKADITLNVWSKKILESCDTHLESHYALDEAGVWADAIRKRKAIFQANFQCLEKSSNYPSEHFHLESHMSIPVFSGDCIVAILGVANGKEAYTGELAASVEVRVNSGWQLLEAKLVEMEQRSLHVSQSFEGLSNEQVVLSLADCLSSAVALKDQYTVEHQHNVAFVSEQIAIELELEQKQIMGLVLGALLHDIGKISIPSQILNKPGKLTGVEYELLKSHAESGANIFSKGVFPWPLKDIVGQHHERMDGSGYPLGLTRKDICIEARIIAVADTFDAMASDRPYRVTQGIAKAIETIVEGRMHKYDAYVVDAFMRCVEKDPSFGDRYSAKS